MRWEVAYSLDVVSDFLGDELSDVDILGVLDADLISIVGGNLKLSVNKCALHIWEEG